jgi:hypothetical protein
LDFHPIYFGLHDVPVFRIGFVRGKISSFIGLVPGFVSRVNVALFILWFGLIG